MVGIETWIHAADRVAFALIDDLDGNADPAEDYIIQATAFQEAAELALLTQHNWVGTGKWLVRNLRSIEDFGLLRWAVDQHDPKQLALICRQVLAAAGGYLQDGFVRGKRPPHLTA